MTKKIAGSTHPPLPTRKDFKEKSKGKATSQGKKGKSNKHGKTAISDALKEANAAKRIRKALSFPLTAMKDTIRLLVNVLCQLWFSKRISRWATTIETLL